MGKTTVAVAIAHALAREVFADQDLFPRSRSARRCIPRRRGGDINVRSASARRLRIPVAWLSSPFLIDKPTLARPRQLRACDRRRRRAEQSVCLRRSPAGAPPHDEPRGAACRGRERPSADAPRGAGRRTGSDRCAGTCLARCAALHGARRRGRALGAELSDADAPILAAICRRLDGIALAIELAAGRDRHLWNPRHGRVAR